MKRSEAIFTLKDIKPALEGSESAVSLVESKPEDSSVGYQLHIKATLASIDKKIVDEVAKKRRLNVKEEKDEFIIFQPKEG
jgi:hypothetical protein